MFKKIRLFFQIRKFYKLFGSVVGANFITKLSDITTDNLGDVQYDINEVLYEDEYGTYSGLTELYNNIETIKETTQNA